MSLGLDQNGAGAVSPRKASRLGAAGGAALFGAGVLTLAAGVVLWASEGARVFVETGFSAMLACL